MPLTAFDSFDNFQPAKDIQLHQKAEVIEKVKSLDEKEALEPFIQAILNDTNKTPHGPAELVDIFTHKVTLNRVPGVAAFILKGKSFPTIKPKDVSHQIFRLEKISALKYTFLVAPGIILDEAKEQFISTAERLNCHYSIMDANDLARLFVAFGFICPRDSELVAGGVCSCGYRPRNRTSNILQQDALRALSDTHKFGHRSGLVILPTGAGKTRVAVKDIHQQECRLVVYTAHSHEILQSAAEEFKNVFSKDEILSSDIITSSASLRRVNLITIQSLIRNLDKFSGVEVDYFVVDECHHAAAPSYQRAINTLRPHFLLGLTATPFRGDHKDVIDLCGGNIVVNHELRMGIECGVLCPYHYYGCFDNIDYTQINRNGNRYDIRDLERFLIIPERDNAIISKWVEKAANVPTLAFCCSHTHALRIKESFRERGIPSEVYLSETSQEERLLILDRFRIGNIKVLCVVDVLNEGVDLPFVECLLFLRPTESKRIFFQQLGRGLRRYYGKSACIIIDFIGNFKNAYKILEYQGLEPEESEIVDSLTTTHSTIKEILNLPIGCTVDFDERVIGIFGDQTQNLAFATRHNIARLLVYQYERLAIKLGHYPSKKEVDRSLIVGSRFYAMVFGSWDAFIQKAINAESGKEAPRGTTGKIPARTK